MNAHNEVGRRRTVAFNWNMLNRHYNASRILEEPVLDVHTLLIRMHWRGFYQLPEHDLDLTARACLK